MFDDRVSRNGGPVGVRRRSLQDERRSREGNRGVGFVNLCSTAPVRATMGGAAGGSGARRGSHAR
eukprot:9342201-Lingulodinium_polyedra.AAC.1